MVKIDTETIKQRRRGSGAKAILLFSALVILSTVCYHELSIDSSPRVMQLVSSPGPLLRSSTVDDQCRFYLAESAIPNSGLGLFTSIDLKKGQQAQAMTDICIYVADTPDDTHFETHSWARDVWFGSFEGRNPRAACEGFATTFNSMPPGVATSKLTMLGSHDNGGLKRDKDPGAGAISQYYGISSTAIQNIQSGSELTIDYGDWEYDQSKKYEAPIRTVPWIRKHGMCIDNIRIHTATDPKMGRGAFASRSLRKHAVVSPAPIQVFPKRGDFARGIPEALFVNYCFQAGEMLLFPYGPGVNLINHDRTKPNVKLQWSTHSMSHSNWLDLPLAEFLQMDYPGGLILDVVALRDIAEDEELFLDYGESWQHAWDIHVSRWKPSIGEYVYAADMDLTKPFRTMDEQRLDPYPSNLKTICWTSNWERNADTMMKWKRPKFEWPEGLVYCNILNRITLAEGKYLYKVSLNFEEGQPDLEDTLSYIDTDVPHSAISFTDKPYRSDLHLRDSFRHPIELPSNLIPKEWVSATDV